MAEWVRHHHACPVCGSTDGASTNSEGWTTCFSGNHTGPKSFKMDDNENVINDLPKKKEFKGLVSGECEALPQRGLTLDTVKRFNYQVSHDRRYQVAPYYAKGVLVAQHLRPPNKKKGMPWVGDNKHPDLEMFGEHTWGSGGKMVVLTEGELDAMSVSQAQGNRWAVGSVWEGAQAAHKNVAQRMSTLSKFDKIILLFDADLAGQEAAEKTARVLPGGKAYIASIPGYKDANEALVAGREDLIVKAIWEARPWRPDGLVTAADIKERLLRKPSVGLGWFDDTLDVLTYGRHPDKGQVWVIGAGVGIGKSSWLLRQLHHDLMVLKEPVAGFFLETDTAELYQRIAAIEDGYPYHLPDPTGAFDHPARGPEDLWKTVEKFDGRFHAYDSLGMADLETIIAHTRYLASQGTRIFYLDNLTQLTDESRMRESVEETIREIKDTAVELKVIFMVASHLATPDKGSHEEGAPVSLRQFYGSRKLPAWVDGAIGLERDSTHANGVIKRLSIARLLKVRVNGSAVGERVGYQYNSAMDAVECYAGAVALFDRRNEEGTEVHSFDADPDIPF